MLTIPRKHAFPQIFYIVIGIISHLFQNQNPSYSIFITFFNAYIPNHHQPCQFYLAIVSKGFTSHKFLVPSPSIIILSPGKELIGYTICNILNITLFFPNHLHTYTFHCAWNLIFFISPEREYLIFIGQEGESASLAMVPHSVDHSCDYIGSNFPSIIHYVGILGKFFRLLSFSSFGDKNQHLIHWFSLKVKIVHSHLNLEHENSQQILP